MISLNCHSQEHLLFFLLDIVTEISIYTIKKQTHRYREPTSGCQWREAKGEGVRECLTGGFLRAVVSHESFVPLQAEQNAAPRD